jgi:hypothetical protein
MSEWSIAQVMLERKHEYSTTQRPAGMRPTRRDSRAIPSYVNSCGARMMCGTVSSASGGNNRDSFVPKILGLCCTNPCCFVWSVYRVPHSTSDQRRSYHTEQQSFVCMHSNVGARFGIRSMLCLQSITRIGLAQRDCGIHSPRRWPS